LNDVVRGKGVYKDDKCAHCGNILEEVDEDGAAVRGGAVERPRKGTPQAIPKCKTIHGGIEGGGVRGSLESPIPTVDRQGCDGSTLVYVEVESASGVYTEKTKDMEVRRPAKNACTCEEENAERKRECHDKRQVVRFIIHCFQRRWSIGKGRTVQK